VTRKASGNKETNLRDPWRSVADVGIMSNPDFNYVSCGRRLVWGLGATKLDRLAFYYIKKKYRTSSMTPNGRPF